MIVGRCRRDVIQTVCEETLYQEYYRRQVLVRRGLSKESGCVMSAIIGMQAGIPKDMLNSCTFDNGKEFAFFKQLEQALGVKVYFAKPYHSWERGTNENRNGVVRKGLPGRAGSASPLRCTPCGDGSARPPGRLGLRHTTGGIFG